MGKKWMKVLGCVVAAFVAVTGVNASGDKNKTLKLAVTDIEGLENLQREFGPFRDKVNALTGLNIEFFAVTNRTAAVEAMRSKKIDFALTGPAEYVVFKKLVDTQLVVGFSRPDYYGIIITLADSGIANVDDLKGKKLAIGSVGSTSKHLAPLQIIKDNGVDPLKDMKKIHTGVKLGWESLKRGDVAAMGTTNSKFVKLRAKETTLEPGAFRVIARGPDLPNDVLLAGSHVNPKHIETLRQVFTQYSKEIITEMLKGEENSKYKGMKFLTNVKDSDYNYVRHCYATAGFAQFSTFIGE